ncbi:MAG: type III polyketide synthase [Candidatus Dormibacteria bacterium]
MTRFLGFGLALPGNRLEAEESRAHLGRLWPELRRVETDAVTRFTVQPPEEIFSRRSLSERMDIYRREAPRLARLAAELALADAGVAPGTIDMVVSVSCTGYMVPSLEVELAQELGLREDVLRLPLTELGCSGGAAALAVAHRHLRLDPRARVLLVCVELCSLTFQPEDTSLDNLVAAMVFGDGAVAAVLGGGQGGLEVLATRSRLVPGTSRLLGFDLRGDGFHPVLDRRLPRLLRQQVGCAVAGFGEGPIGFCAVHSGGPRIFDAVESGLGLGPGSLAASRDVFRRYGNLSSASLLLVLSELRQGPPEMGLGLAFGPGVSLEMAALRRSPE